MDDYELTEGLRVIHINSQTKGTVTAVYLGKGKTQFEIKWDSGHTYDSLMHNNPKTSLKFIKKLSKLEQVLK